MKISKIHISFCFFIFVVSSLSISNKTYAATTSDYPANCRYANKNKKVKYIGPCNVNFGLAGMNSQYGARYIVTFPNKTEITVLLYENDLALINQIPAKRLPSPLKTIRFITGENEDFQFTTPPPESL